MAPAMSNELQHRTVLLEEAVNALVTRADGIYIDGTFGRGGHSRAVLAKLGESGRLIGFDKDPLAIATAQQIADPRFEIVHESFASLRDAMSERGVGRVSGVLLDLGVSSPQFDDPERGFSFRALSGKSSAPRSSRCQWKPNGFSGFFSAVLRMSIWIRPAAC